MSNKDCDGCGRWSSELKVGLCPFCASKYPVAPIRTVKPTRLESSSLGEVLRMAFTDNKAAGIKRCTRYRGVWHVYL